MIKLKSLLCEIPDDIKIDDKYVGFKNASHTFLLYNDIVDRRKYWVAYVYPKYRNGGKVILCENEELEPILNQNFDSKFDVWPAHSNLRILLVNSNRLADDSDDYSEIGTIDGRLFFEKYMSFWSERADIVKYKAHWDDFLNRIKVNHNDVLVEEFSEDVDDGIMIPYNTFFGTQSGEVKKMGAYEKAKLELAKKLHMDKAMLDKKVLDVIQSRPKDIETLYARLEKQFNMPFYKIKQIFRDVPLDKLIVKQLKECIERMKK